MENTALHWDSAISYTTKDEIRVRGYNLVSLMGEYSFPETLHLLITGEFPSKKVGKLLEALMVASIDHGPATPSVLTARTAASGGASVKNATAAGFMALDRSHGAAVEGCMSFLMKVCEKIEGAGTDDEKKEIIKAFLAEERAAGRKIVPGFGHRQHPHDPRKDKLFAMAEDAGVKGRYVAAAELVSAVLSERSGKELPINIDGAMAAILCELNYPLELGNVPFLISRLCSLFVHSYEEIKTMPRMRRIDPCDIGYNGVADRDIPENRE